MSNFTTGGVLLLENSSHDEHYAIDQRQNMFSSFNNIETDHQDHHDDDEELLPSGMKECLTAVAYLEPVPLSLLHQALKGRLATRELKDILNEACRRGWLLLDEKNKEQPMYLNLAKQVHVYLDGDDEKSISRRRKIHLEYARRIWNNVSPEDLDHAASTIIVGQFLRSSVDPCLLDGSERHSLSRLCLLAGQSSVKSSEFIPALTYFEYGIELLGDAAWTDDTYDISLALHNAAAEMLLVTTNYESMENYIDIIIKNATNQQDSLLAKCTRLHAMGASGDENAAIDYAIDIMESLGEKLPRQGNLFLTIWQVIIVKRRIGNKTDADFLGMPPMTDPNKLMCMRIINTIFLRTIFVRPSLVALTGCKFIELTLRYGMSAMSPNAFACYGLMMGKKGDLKSADRFGRLSVAMLDQLGIIESLPRVYAAYYGTIFSITNPLLGAQGSLPKLIRAYEVGMQTGDLEFACFNISLYCILALAAGVSLHEIKATWEHSRQLMASFKQEALLRFSWASMQAVYRYMGIAGSSEDAFDTEEVCKYFKGNHMESMMIYVRIPQLVGAYIFNADEFPHLRHCIKSAKTNPRMDYTTQWMCSLCLLKEARSGKTSKWKAMIYVRQTLPRLRRLQKLCPINFLEKVFLLEAEVAALKNRVNEALVKYVCCIAVAHKAKTTYVEAMANERAARFLLELRRDNEAQDYMQAAYNCYFTWGAYAKAKKLQDEFSFLSCQMEEQLTDQFPV